MNRDWRVSHARTEKGREMREISHIITRVQTRALT